jgi:hypothetical protein
MTTDDALDAREAPGVVLVVNVRARWREVLRGEATDEDAVLGDWNLRPREIDPRQVRAVLGSRNGIIVRAYTVTGFSQVPGTKPIRTRFTAGARLHHLELKASPYTWRQGEMYPVAVLPADDFVLDTPTDHIEIVPLDFGATGEVTIGGITLRVTDQGATLTVPPGLNLSIRTLTKDPVRPAVSAAAGEALRLATRMIEEATRSVTDGSGSR